MSFVITGLWSFALILVRLSGLFAAAPLFSSVLISAKTKIGIAIFLSIFLAAALPTPNISMSNPDVALPAVAGEFVVGLLLGFGFRLAMTAAMIAGELVGLQMGLGAASLIDPSSGQNAALMGNFYSLAFTVLFVSFDGHHHLLRVLNESFRTMPLAGSKGIIPPIEQIIRQSGETLIHGCRLAAPVLIPLVMLTLASAWVSRIFPQANMLTVSYGISMFVGMLLLAASVPALGGAMWDSIQQADRYAMRVLRALSSA